MSPRRSVADAQRTRGSIVDRAAAIGSQDGLGSLSFGRVAEDLALSKSGVIRHFPTKEDLQLAALAEGRRIFRTVVWEPVADRQAGLVRLRAAMASWMAYLEDCPLPGGCILAAASTEFDGQPGAVHDAVRDDDERWARTLERDIDIAIRAGELPPDTDLAQLSFELRGIGLAVNQRVQLRGDPRSAEYGRRAVERLLGGGVSAA
jgi:AcrR family transcriptional regulator